MIVPVANSPRSTSGRPSATVGRPSPTSAAAGLFVAGRISRARALGHGLADRVQDPGALASALNRGLTTLADPAHVIGQQSVAPGIGRVLGVRSPLLRAAIRAFAAATQEDSPASLLLIADRLLGEPVLEARWFAFAILERTLDADTERSWQLVRRAGRDARDWITVDTLARTVGRGVLAEEFRWAELEQLVYSRSPWERRLVGSTIATIPFVNRITGRRPDVAARGLTLLGQLIGDPEPDVQRALSWAYRSLTVVDLAATGRALQAEADRAVGTLDGNRAWVIRDALTKLEPTEATRIRTGLDGIRRRPGAPSTAVATATAARFTALGLGRALPEPPLT